VAARPGEMLLPAVPLPALHGAHQRSGRRPAPHVRRRRAACDTPVSQRDKPVSQCDKPVSQRDKPVSQRDNSRVEVRHGPFRGVADPTSDPCSEKNLRAPLTFRRGEPIVRGTNPSLERAEGLAANGGTRVLNKDSEVRTECGS
jgi:hypothetical protein